MSNVIHLNLPSRRQTRADCQAGLLRCFARHRRFGDDVFWLKENAELLNILECTRARGDTAAAEALADAVCAAHEGFYARVERRLGFFPQYYRFLLSICLDLEDLGMPGTKSEALCHWVAREGLAEAELSDLQRAEARRLMARRGVDPLPADGGLTERLHRFIDRSETFAMPNKKAAYELTHIVFYLSEYGRRDPCLSADALVSLDYAGLLAFLDQNADLLAEICVALRHAGAEPPAIWEDWLEQQTHRFAIATGAQADPADDYHEYFVCNWALMQAGRSGFVRPLAEDRASFHRPRGGAGPLREISECMYRLAEARSGDWGLMRPLVEASLTEPGRAILDRAERSSPRFGAFFAGFARTGLRGVAL